MEYLIIGNSAAGINCADKIRSLDKTGKITILSEEPFEAYGRPLISYYLAGKYDINLMKYKPEEFYKNKKINVVLNCQAQEIDVKNKEVKCSNKKAYKYDKLLIATGSVPFVPPVNGIEKHKNVFTFLKLEDAKKIEKVINKKSKVIIVGAGLIGLKAAEALAGKVGQISVIDLADRLMASVLDKQTSAIMQKHIEEQKIDFKLSTTVSEVKPDSVILSDGTELNCDVLIMAVGVKPNILLAKNAKIKINRGIITDKYMMTSVKNIYAAGDCVESLDVLSQQNKILALWPNAFMQGETAGSNMAGVKCAFNGSFAMNAIGFFGIQLISAGIVDPKEQGYQEFVEYDETKITFKKLIIKDDKLVGFAMLNLPYRAGIYTSLINDKISLRDLNYDITKRDIGLNVFSQDIRYNKMFRGKNE
ncbi:MAG: FAD-dependent oxidoreductase [Endomicrobiaceae bacterium]|nr:FAD-dependent oxidoreductase [Endomicrobiaceae bacterium]